MPAFQLFNTGKRRLQLALVVATASAVFIGGCSEKTPEPDSQQAQAPTPSSIGTALIDTSDTDTRFWQAIDTQLGAMLGASQALDARTSEFLNTPTPENLKIAQDQLIEVKNRTAGLSALSYLVRSAPSIFRESASQLFKIQAHPIQPGYLDRFGPYKYSGLVFDIGFKLNTASLIDQHGLTDSEEVVLGVYAIEFMLMGENRGRSAQDYAEVLTLNAQHIEQKLSQVAEVPNNRRRSLLSLQIEQLLSDLTAIRSLYSSATSSDFMRWHTESSQQKISKVRSGLQNGVTVCLVALAELQAAFDKGSSGNDTPADAEQVTIAKAEQQAKLLAAKIESLKSMTVYFSDVERNAIDDALGQAAQTLSSLSFDDIENAKKQTQSVYEQLKTTI